MLTSYSALCLFCIISCEARLTSKQTDPTIKPSNESHLIRVTRTPEDPTDPPQSEAKVPRAVKNDSAPRQTTKNVAGKKPNFNDFEYDDEFQSTIPKTKAADSNEYEDDDFSLGDYEFDIHHDEFVGVRSRPLEPRLRATPKPESYSKPQKQSNPARHHKSSSKGSGKESSTKTDDASEDKNDKNSNSNQRSRRSMDEYYDDEKMLHRPQADGKDAAESTEDKSYTVRIMNDMDSNFDQRSPSVVSSTKSAKPKKP